MVVYAISHKKNFKSERAIIRILRFVVAVLAAITRIIEWNLY